MRIVIIFITHFFIFTNFIPSPSSSSLPPVMKNGKNRNWAELPPELTSSILQRLSVIEILENAQKVCRSWRCVCKDPSMWQKIDMPNIKTWKYDIEAMYRHTVDLSQGGLLDVNLVDFETDSLLTYIADRSSNLRRIRIIDNSQYTMSDGIFKEVVKFPLLEEFELSYCLIRGQDLKSVGQSCPNLRTLKLKSNRFSNCGDCVALAIAATMPGLRHLQLSRDGLSDTGLNAILKGCPHLRHLHLHQCDNVTIARGSE